MAHILVVEDDPNNAFVFDAVLKRIGNFAVSYTHLRAHETPEHLVCRLLLEKKKINKKKKNKQKNEK